ncbi:hypothetical protein FRAAL0188 [Frankia alni ACN14a]|uniref:Uncharacterized protein n=1 Tax=Frankia alni (strain DSM 45986 / CECT 9034 / ACN14a) TaxID=326424 RepID=Q0RU78_FRAAA|nr:hypothetical protein FRAAL0188 [Frankia alni ACN14a]
MIHYSTVTRHAWSTGTADAGAADPALGPARGRAPAARARAAPAAVEVQKVIALTRWLVLEAAGASPRPPWRGDQRPARTTTGWSGRRMCR